MDVSKLRGAMKNKPTVMWDQKDVAKWLHFIKLPQLVEPFKTASIDGSCIMLLEETDLINDLAISSVITRKKLLNWIQNGLFEYNQALEQQEDLGKFSNEALIPGQYNDPALRPKTTEMNQMQSVPAEQGMEEEQPDKEQVMTNRQFQLLVLPTEQVNSSQYCIDQKGGRIGRHQGSQMVVLEESVSRHHAKIEFIDGQFMISDIGSTTGTFIKIQQRYTLECDMMIELGSNQISVRNAAGEGPLDDQLLLVVVEGPYAKREIKIDGKEVKAFTIGRKEQNNLIAFQDDQHLSNTHARIYRIENQWVIEDMSSTNGTWRRLSPEYTTSAPFPLTTKSIFKVGSSSIFICEVKDTSALQSAPAQPEKASELLCIICVENDRDAIYMPCRHNAACIKCTKMLKTCPICKVEIMETIRIYRA